MPRGLLEIVCVRVKANSSSRHQQADKLQTLIKAAKVEDVEPIWTSIFAKVRPDRDCAVIENWIF